MTPTPADEALARETEKLYTAFFSSEANLVDVRERAAQLIAVHRAAQAPSGLVEAFRKHWKFAHDEICKTTGCKSDNGFYHCSWPMPPELKEGE